MNKIKFAVLGCGHIGKRHAEMINRNNDSALMAIIDIKDKESLNLDYDQVPFFSSLRDFLSSGIETDVITIATPNGLHAEQALVSLEAKKHVVIEKPLALTKKDAEKILSKAFQVHKHVFAVMQNRYSPPIAWAKKILDENILGRIFMVQVNCFWNRDERYYTGNTWHGTQLLDGGSLFTQFSHFVDILYWLVGDIEKIRSSFKSFNHEGLTEFEDSGIIQFELAGGAMGCMTFTTSTWDKNMESSITVIGENGSFKIGGQYMDKLEYVHIKNYTMPVLPPTNAANHYGPYSGSAANHGYIIENVIDVLHGKNTITTNALEGLKVVEIIERMYQKGNQ
ncbi:MAG: Gfo/Idh/MocA family oxidoreductase [Bacteroidetes bacterium]|nr:Gfo/Idh/MocA family oxidoreductase [Bacteroidota bacterium]